MLARTPGLTSALVNACALVALQAEEAIPLLAEDAAKHKRCVACVCDANVQPPAVLQFLDTVAPLMRHGAVMAFTLKRFAGSSAEFAAQQRDIRAAFAVQCGCPESDVRIIHLLANGASEVTLLAKWARA
ncbi:MAG: hypothetical protein EOO41_03220 [Methanobacteriota archaeon]|nr:MAG: hypothetical protein EOO41_03220 [Euryarchaeota archaeon]